MHAHEDSRERANALAAAWRQSERAFHDRRREQNRAAWQRWHLEQAAILEATAARLAANHREEGRSLGDGPIEEDKLDD